MNKTVRLVWVIVAVSISALFAQGEEKMANNNPGSEAPQRPIFCVLFHSPGPNWKEGIPFQEQPGVMDHVMYMKKQLDDGVLLMGGPLLDNSGGMMVCRSADPEAARKMAEADPAVVAGLLKVEVKQWMIPMTSVDFAPAGQ